MQFYMTAPYKVHLGIFILRSKEDEILFFDLTTVRNEAEQWTLSSLKKKKRGSLLKGKHLGSIDPLEILLNWKRFVLSTVYSTSRTRHISWPLLKSGSHAKHKGRTREFTCVTYEERWRWNACASFNWCAHNATLSALYRPFLQAIRSSFYINCILWNK